MDRVGVEPTTSAMSGYFLLKMHQRWKENYNIQILLARSVSFCMSDSPLHRQANF